MIRRQLISTRTDTHFPYTTLFRCQRDATAFDPGELARRAPLVATAVRARDPRPARRDDHCQRQHARAADAARSEEHTSELQSLMRISYAVFCLKKKTHTSQHKH